MKLWKATIEIEVLIASEEAPDDEAVIYEAEDELRDNSGCAEVTSVDEVLSYADIPNPWQKSIPRGDAEYLTCEQILDTAIEARKVAALSKPMSNQMVLPITEAP
jgi:hypothetical protein